jgi:hypothetical protein
MWIQGVITRARVFQSIKPVRITNHTFKNEYLRDIQDHKKNVGLLQVICSYILSPVNVYITMENHHAINGKIHYFNGHFQ